MKNFYSVRMKSPKGASKIRTQDVGRKGHTERVAMLKNGKWQTQSWRFSKKDFKRHGNKLVPKNAHAKSFIYKSRYNNKLQEVF